MANNQNAAVISFSNLQRIKNQCAIAPEQDMHRTQMKQSLYEKSQSRVKNWPNTISALREKKEKDRIKKLEEEEIERRKVDALEEALQNELRNEAIMKANKQLFD